MEMTTTPSTEGISTNEARCRRLIVAAERVDDPHLVRVVESFCGLGGDAAVELVVATLEHPEAVVPELLRVCGHLDLRAAAPIDVVHIDELDAMNEGDLGVFLGGADAGTNLAAALNWISSVRTPAVTTPWRSTTDGMSPIESNTSASATSLPNLPMAIVFGQSARREERLAHLERELGADREALRRLGQPPSIAGLEAVAELCRPIEWIDGYLSLVDAQFLYDMVHTVRPTRVLEIGTASGYSASVILRALHDAGVPLRDRLGEPVLSTYDIASRCYWDANRPVGGALAEMVPDLMHGVNVITGTVSDAVRQMASRPASLAFIDASHQHPWPTVDLLLASLVLLPGSWVVLHDVRLSKCSAFYGEITGTDPGWDQRGAEHLYDNWPYERLIERISPTTNIAAVRLPTDRRLHVRDLADALSIPWECEVPNEVLAQLERVC